MESSEKDWLPQLIGIVGEAGVVRPDDTGQRTLNLQGERMARVPLLRPASTDEVVALVRLAREAGRSLIPVGGATGLVNALKPTTGKEWYLSMERMRQIERIDPVSRVAVVQAGVVLQALQDAAADRQMLFATDLGARGSATIGGLVSTNAGGERVLRFGMMREQVLGLEVVTADGTVLDLMAEVLKNNAGYDLKQLFIGSEGTLGIVTRAVVRLRPAFAGHHAAFLALASLDGIDQVLTQLERGLGGTLSAFELMWPEFLQTMCAGEGAPHRPPVPLGAAGYVLVEIEGGDPLDDRARFMETLEGMMESGLVMDAAIAESDAERQAFWAIRNDITRIVKTWSPVVAFDVSVPISHMVGYVEELRRDVAGRWPQGRVLVFGHVADNNLHVVVGIGPGTYAHADEIAQAVYRGVRPRRGSISAEHGIGLDKRDALAGDTPAPVLQLMRQLKQWMDPADLLNPGKVI